MYSLAVVNAMKERIELRSEMSNLVMRIDRLLRRKSELVRNAGSACHASEASRVS
jgi:hypothetical protein